MIIIALGANIPGPWGRPALTIERALHCLDRPPFRRLAASRLYRTAPFGVTDQPAFVNAAAVIETRLDPAALLRELHAIEAAAGRRRQLRWGPRTLDLDLIDHNGLIRRGGLHQPVLPHPGIAQRQFVLAPIGEIRPFWRHPLTHLTAREMLARLGREVTDG